MPKVCLWVENAAVPAAARIRETFQKALQLFPRSVSGADTLIVLDAAQLELTQLDSAQWIGSNSPEVLGKTDDLFLPLTFYLPPRLTWAEQALYSACQDIAARRHQVSQWGYSTGDGDLVLPIVLTAKGPLYAEVIGPALEAEEPLTQPVHFSDMIRQPLYGLGKRLLRSLNASPAVYFLQFSVEDKAVYFDRLLPFPDERAIASINVQTPDLLTCHWLCKTHQPICDLMV